MQGAPIKAILTLFISLALFAQDYPTFTIQEFEAIEKNDVISKNRIVDYSDYIDSCEKDSQKKQLNKINFYLNGLLAQYDDVIKKKEDDWSTPKEFLTIGYGDCEDYAIIKYYSLIKLGFDEKKLFITVVKENFRGGRHMVLTYFENKNQSPLVLDNLSFRILNLKKRSDLQAEYFINSTGVYRLSGEFKLTKVAQKHKNFEELRIKVGKNL